MNDEYMPTKNRLSKIKATSAEELLEMSRKQERNIELVQSCAKKVGLELMDFLSNDVLELYYNVYTSDGEDICYISKGWDDEGFRVGNIKDLSQYTQNLQDKFTRIFKACAKNLISIDVLNRKSGHEMTLSLEIPIYQNGLTEEVLSEVVNNMRSTMQDINRILLY